MTSAIKTLTEEESIMAEVSFEKLVNAHLATCQGKVKVHIVRNDTKPGFKATHPSIVQSFVEQDEAVNKIIQEIEGSGKNHISIPAVNDLTAIVILVESPNPYVTLEFFLQGYSLRCAIQTKQDPY